MVNSALRLTLPILMGYLPLGMAFSIAWLQQGFPWWAAILASVFLYAGSMQFLLIGLLASGVDFTGVLVATLAVNFRHVFYGLSFQTTAFKNHPFAMLYAIFSLTDEAYSLTSQLPVQKNHQQILRIHLLCHSYWILGTVLGLIAGRMLPSTLTGFDFALSALFIVLAQNHFYHHERRPVLLLGFVAITGALLLTQFTGIDKKQILAIAIGLLLMLLLVFPRENFLVKDSVA